MSVPGLPGNSHINLLGSGKRVVDLDAEVSHNAFDFLGTSDKGRSVTVT